MLASCLMIPIMLPERQLDALNFIQTMSYVAIGPECALFKIFVRKTFVIYQKSTKTVKFLLT